MIILIILLLLLVLLVITNNRQENFINLDNNSDIKVVKPGDPKFNYFEYEFDFSDFRTVDNNYLLTATSNLANLGHIYNEGVILIIHDDIIYLKNNKNEWYFLSKQNPYNLYFWEPIVKKTDIQKLDSIV
jgi:hypothetical protein